MLFLSGLKLPENHTLDDLKTVTAKQLSVESTSFTSFEIIKKSLDCRKKRDIHYVYSVAVSLENESLLENSVGLSIYSPLQYSSPVKLNAAHRPVVIGSGPAGLFAALSLSKGGFRPFIIERGQPVEQRIGDVQSFWKTGKLNPESNVQFGEGGAGTFSDGKLTTGTSDTRKAVVLREFVAAGAPEEILYLSKPHIGTDKLRGMVKNLRERIIGLGGEFMFGARLIGFKEDGGKLKSIRVETGGVATDIPAENAILAIGHSARDTFEMLQSSGVFMAQKAFSVGVRIEHLQEQINFSQYGGPRGNLPPADYKLSLHLPGGRGVYTFCMCPGGTVVAAASEEGHLVVNGMSEFARDGKNANSALLVSVTPEDFASPDPLAGVALQRKIERAAFLAGGDGYTAPAETVGDFLAERSPRDFGEVLPSYLPGVAPVDLRTVLPDFVTDSIAAALPAFDRKLRGFANASAVMTGVEARSSSPVRILRDESLQANIRGIFPCGEGCGYAGGIMSAAVDGLKCAEAVAARINGG